MSIRVLPAVIAGISALVLAFVLFVPFVAREYRKRGHLGWSAVALRFAVLVYGLGLIAYVLIPLPPVAPGFCAAFDDLHPQLHPLASLPRLDSPARLATMLGDSGVRQFGLNIVLFVPLGMFLRHLRGRGVLAVTVVGFGVSLLVELTQLTGIWYLYPCPYRLFDVDDLIANTAGAAVGGVLAPALRVLPGQRGAVPSTEPRPVTVFRRLLGMGCDLLLMWWLGTILLRGLDAGFTAGGGRWGGQFDLWLAASALWFAPALLFGLITALGRGTTLGQHAVLLRTTRSDGARPRLGAMLGRWCFGAGGLAVLEGVLSGLGQAHWGTLLAVVWCTAHAVGVARSPQRRGISHRLTGLQMTDTRSVSTGSTDNRPPLADSVR